MRTKSRFELKSSENKQVNNTKERSRKAEAHMYKSVRENIVIIRGYIFKRVLLFTKLRSPTFSISYFFLEEEEVSPIRSATSVLKAEAKRSARAEAPGASLGAISRSSMAIFTSFSDGGERETGGNCS